ncbi:MAG: hypothetical protein ACT4QC_07730 [Planctomycetaceae bacterium]
MSERRDRPTLAFWVTVVGAVLAIYVLSSGPTQEIGKTISRREMRYDALSPTPDSAWLELAPGRWWQTAYYPLVWCSGQPLGAPLRWYWRLFPLGDVEPGTNDGV